MMLVLKTVFYVPLYNGLIFLIDIIPGASAGVAVIALTLLIKLLLFPLSYKASKFQYEMRIHEPEINRLKAAYRNDRQAQGKAILEFYREKNINPFAGILPLLIQIPIVIALYYVFYAGGLPSVDTALLYSFVPTPDVNMHFFGIDIAGKSMVLAIAVGISQLLQGHLSLPPIPQKTDTPSFGSDLARGMQFQMKYIFPLVMGFVAYAVSGAVALYFITSSLFTACQELYLRRLLKKGIHSTHGSQSQS
jgi:YidC/Oxa1 family membrane protein insertase